MYVLLFYLYFLDIILFFPISVRSFRMLLKFSNFLAREENMACLIWYGDLVGGWLAWNVTKLWVASVLMLTVLHLQALMTEDNVKFTKSRLVLALLIIMILKRSWMLVCSTALQKTQDLCSLQYKRSIRAWTPFPPSVSANCGRETRFPTLLVRAMWARWLLHMAFLPKLGSQTLFPPTLTSAKG